MKKIIAIFTAISPEFISNFEYLVIIYILPNLTYFQKQRLERLENIKQKDSFIKDENINKNIPYELGDVDCLFYDLDKEVDLNLLAKLYEDNQVLIKQHERESAQHGFSMEEEFQDLELPGLNRQQQQFPQLPNNGMEGGLFEWNDEIDLMDLANLPLRRM